MNNIILADVDGVVLDYNTAFSRYMDSLGISVIDENNYNYAFKYDISDDLVEEHCRTFSSSTNMKTLDFLPNSFNVINKLYDEKSLKVHFITAISNDSETIAARTENLLQKVNPDAIHAITCLGFLEDKYEFLKAHYEGCDNWWIEDSVPNYESGIKIGLRSLLMDQPYNRYYNTDNRIFSWDEVYNKITNEEL